jgi:hypothetical protein
MLKSSASLILKVIKWPLALLFVCILPAVALETLKLLKSQATQGGSWFWVFAGASTVIGWMTCTRFRVTRFLTTMEHEFIHVLLAWLTGLRVESLKVQSDGNGLAMIETPFNWLVALGPYFIPLALYLYAFISIGMGVEGTVAEALFGLIFGYEMVANIRESHLQQTDFQIAGRVFTFCFLPTAMLLTYGGAFQFLASGELGTAWHYMGSTLETSTLLTWNWGQGLIGG